MATRSTSRSKPYVVDNAAEQSENIDEMFDILFQDLFLETTGTLPATLGGTGFSSYAVGNLLYADTTTTLAKLAASTAGKFLRAAGANTAPAWSTTIWTNSATTGDLLYASAADTYSNLAAVAAGRILRAAGTSTAPAYSTFTIPDTFVTGDLLYASATNVLTALADIATGNALISGGVTTAPSWGKIGLTTHISGVLAEANGGTNQSTYTTGDLLYASAANTLNKLADIATGSYLRSGGVSTAPLWSTLVLPNSATADRVVYATSTNTWGESANLAFNGTVLTVSGFGTHSFSTGGTGVNRLEIRNTTAGTGNFGNLAVGNDSSATATGVYAFSSTYTESGASFPSGGLVQVEGAGGLSLQAIHVSGDVRIYSRNVLAATFGSAQTLTLTGGLTVAGGGTFGSGIVALIGADGKINGPLSSTILDDLSAANLTSLPAANLLIASQATGDLLYASSTTVWARLAIGAAGTFLQGGTTPSWAKIPAISSTYFTDLSGANLTGILEANITDGTVLARVAAAESITGAYSFSGIANTGLKILDTGSDHALTIAPGTNLTIARTLTLTTGDADRTVTLSGNPTLADWFDQSVKSGNSPTFAGTNFTSLPAGQLTGTIASAVQDNITRLGTIVSGVWTGTDIALANITTIATASLLGRNTALTGDIEVLTTIPSAVQDNITRTGTVTSGVWNAGAITTSGALTVNGTTTSAIIRASVAGFRFDPTTTNRPFFEWLNSSATTAGSIEVRADLSPIRMDVTAESWLFGSTASSGGMLLRGTHVTYAGNLLDLDTTRAANAAFNLLNIAAGGVNKFVVSGLGNVTVAGTIFINDTSNANNALGLTINQGANDDHAVSAKSSDVATGLTTITTQAVETDDWLSVSKYAALTGGVNIQALGENAVVATNLTLTSYGGQATTTGGTTARALVEIYASQHDGANALANVTSNGQVFAVRCRRGGADATILSIDEDGDFEVDGSSDVGSTLTIGAGGGNVGYGTYTPALTNVVNLTSSGFECQYLQVGSTVTVGGKVNVTPTLTATTTRLGIALPIASNIGAEEDCGGTAFASGIAGQGAAIRGDATNNRAEMVWVSTDITNQPMYFTFTYQVI